MAKDPMEFCLSYQKMRFPTKNQCVYWPIDGKWGQGDMFFELSIDHEEWKIDQIKDYQTKIQDGVFDGKLTADEAESY